MLTLFFVLLMLVVVGEVLYMTIKLAWKVTKIVFAIILLPVVMIGLAAAGFMTLAIVILLIAGVLALFGSLVAGAR
ncbi:hypothetical protein SAMN02910369_02827 [Lachnospiraceae bacterium NE2001]|nr:hypothetical protein SAMN02910369_01432 [Lachnospiraceae bacterium NE2001]SEQ99060.1 hypothetical protein SAMN02910369_02827 [Lachnospiraceae bacterium NE2001]